MFRADTGGVPPRARPPVVGAEAAARQVLSRGRPAKLRSLFCEGL